jgi:predicted DNA-binding transcriptional regulator YafY
MLPSHICSDVTRVIRLLKIIARLRQRKPGERIGRQLLADEFGCDLRTIQRDIELLQVYLHLPLTYERASKTYTLEPASDLTLSLSLTAEEALALALARGLLTAPGFPHKDTVLAALDKANSLLPAALLADLARAADTLHTDPLARDYSQAPLTPLLEAARDKHSLDLHYQSRSGQQLTWRRVDPYEVALRSGQYWELHGWCHTRQAIRTFALDKIQQVCPASAPFTRREAEWREFQAASGVFGGLRGEAPVAVDVRFDACVATYALDRQWPATLRLSVLPDGSVQMTGIAQGTEGLVVELLSWRRHVLVTGGPELRARMEAEVQAIAARYEKDCDETG